MPHIVIFILMKMKKPFSVLELKGAKDIAVEFFSLSKPYAITGWRLGWLCGNSEVISRFAKAKSTIDNGIFKALQESMCLCYAEF